MCRHVVLLVTDMFASCAVALCNLALSADALVSVKLYIDNFELLVGLLAGVLDVLGCTIGRNHVVGTVDQDCVSCAVDS